MLDLLITADLNILIDDKTPITVTADGGSIVTVKLPSLSAALMIWRRHGSILKPILSSLSTGLTLSSLTIHIVVGDKQIARAGTGVPITFIGRFTSTPRLQVSYSNLLSALFN